MKTILIALALMLPATSFALDKGKVKTLPSAQCEYDVSDARAGLKKLVAVGEQVAKKENGMQLVAIGFHDPSSKVIDVSADAYLDAIVVVRRDDDMPGKEMVVIVGYQENGLPKIVFVRELIEIKQKQPDGTTKTVTTVGPCFNREEK